MDELALMEIAQATFSNAVAQSAIFYSMLGAYLVAAYTVGEKLTKYQLIFLNMLFIVYSVMSNYSLHLSLSMGASYLQEVAAANPKRGIPAETGSIWIATTMNLAAVLGCVFFMFEKRKKSV